MCSARSARVCRAHRCRLIKDCATSRSGSSSAISARFRTAAPRRPRRAARWCPKPMSRRAKRCSMEKPDARLHEVNAAAASLSRTGRLRLSRGAIRRRLCAQRPLPAAPAAAVVAVGARGAAPFTPRAKMPDGASSRRRLTKTCTRLIVARRPGSSAQQTAGHGAGENRSLMPNDYATRRTPRDQNSSDSRGSRGATRTKFSRSPPPLASAPINVSTRNRAAQRMSPGAITGPALLRLRRSPEHRATLKTVGVSDSRRRLRLESRRCRRRREYTTGAATRNRDRDRRHGPNLSMAPAAEDREPVRYQPFRSASRFAETHLPGPLGRRVVAWTREPAIHLEHRSSTPWRPSSQRRSCERHGDTDHRASTRRWVPSILRARPSSANGDLHDPPARRAWKRHVERGSWRPRRPDVADGTSIPR